MILRLRRKQLLERKLLVKERHEKLMAARNKHLALQKDLQESLTKSRERLARLTSLETGEEVEEDLEPTQPPGAPPNDDEMETDQDPLGTVRSFVGVHLVHHSTTQTSLSSP